MAITWKPYDQRLWCEDRAGAVENYGGMGGFFDYGMRWDDFLRRAYDAEDHPRMEALRAEILAKGLRTNGNWHQNDPEGVPTWEDGAVFQASMRAWGDLMAAVWSTADDRDYWYGDFAWADVPQAPARRTRDVDLPQVGSFHG